MNKRALIDALVSELGKSAAVVTKAAYEAHEAATHEESRSENDKDTRGLEAAYLAGAQAERARDLEHTARTIAAIPLRPFGPDTPITAGALIELELDGARHFYFLAPLGGGLRASIDDVDVQVITPQSPLGRELLGKTEGEEIDVVMQQKRRHYEIVRVS
jgi:hypothetical protein